MAANLIIVLFRVSLILIFIPNNFALSLKGVMKFAENTIKSFEPSILEGFAPGTLWCGPGNISESYDQLGFERETDKCCRDHDSCQDYILAGETKYNLTNDSPYTILSCDCDDKLRDCFHSADSILVSSLGNGYFTLADTKCFKMDYPVINCSEHSWISLFHKSKCLQYTYDTSKEKVYQLFDVKPY